MFTNSILFGGVCYTTIPHFFCGTRVVNLMIFNVNTEMFVAAVLRDLTEMYLGRLVNVEQKGNNSMDPEDQGCC